MTKEEIKEVLDERPDLVEFLTLARECPDQIPEVTAYLEEAARRDASGNYGTNI